MEESTKEKLATPVSGNELKSKLRYPLRSALKSKESKPPVLEIPSSSASRRGRSASAVSQSISVLDLSTKEKSVKPPRRLSIPTKSTSSSAAKRPGNITPISESRPMKSTNGQAKTGTPVSNVLKSASQRKITDLTSASYWLAQIKLSESAGKHLISLGFFKLALEAGCEPLQRMRDELKSYASRHNLDELADVMKDLFELYNISETAEQLPASETCSQVPEEGTRSSDEEVQNSPSTGTSRKPKLKTTSADAPRVSTVTRSAKKGTTKTNDPPARTRRSLSKSSANSRLVQENMGRKPQKKADKTSKLEANEVKDKMKKQETKKPSGEEGQMSSSLELNAAKENKENTDVPLTEEVSSTEA